jgi:CRP-like cAMP-binding protein
MSTVQRNRLLAMLAPKDLALLRPSLEQTKLPLRFDLEKPNKRIENVFFIEAGIASVVAIQSDRTRVEVGLIGREGMSGISILLGNHQDANSTYMQVGGEGQRIATDDLRRALKTSATLHASLLKYVQAFLVQTSHTAIANARAKLEERLSRWILMAHDRVGAETLLLTHEFLALMLGVRRAGVTEALHILTMRGLIEASRGQIIVRNRKALERSAGESYGVPEAEYRRLIN